jgi:hypothetical protein
MLPLASRGVELYVHMRGGHREVREIEEWRGDHFCRNFNESRLLVTLPPTTPLQCHTLQNNYLPPLPPISILLSLWGIQSKSA